MTFNTITKLYETLLEKIEKNTTSNNVFGEEIIVITPNNNVANLLKIKLADKKGVVARINFLTKEQFINLKIGEQHLQTIGFEERFLRYHILNILDDPNINSHISSYYKKDFMKKYNYAKDLEASFVYYQNNFSSLLEEFENYNLNKQINSVYELEVLVYKKIKEKGFITLNQAVERVLGTTENIHLICDGNESELFEKLIQKYTNVFLYKLELKGKNEPIRLLNNWSKIREMETVWDYITDTLEKTILMPSDILVLFPNVKQYITAINYVFSKKLNQENKYQYSISNHANQIEVYQQFLTRLRLEINYRLEANKIFDLFNLSRKIKGLNYDKFELTLMKDWITNNAIRKENINEKNIADFSWEKGFEQLILGMMMNSGSFNYLDEYVSKDISFNEYEMLESLYQFVEMIKRLSNSKYSTLEQLNALMIEALIVFFGENEDEESILNKIINLWLEIVNKQLVILNELPPIKVVIKILEEQIKLFKTQHLNSGGIIFGNIKDFNLVDAKLKIVCGLDDISFPQLKIESNLNLDKDKEKRNIKEQQVLFKNLIYNDTEVVLSYIGFNEANRKKINRSIFIDLFIKDKIIEINHKLHPFDKVYIHENNEDYYTYDFRYNASEKLENKSPFVNKDYFEEGIYKNLNDLKKIFKSPVSNWFKNILKVSFPQDEELLKNSPLYFLKQENRLEDSIIKNAILKDYNNQNNDEVKKIKAQGIIPYDSFGKIYINEFNELYSNMAHIFNDQETYELKENLNIIYKDYFLNLPQIYYNLKEDNFLIITSTQISRTEKKRSGIMQYNFRVMFLNYLFEAILIKLAYNKNLKLIGFDKEKELVVYYKNILDILDISTYDEDEQKLLLEEKLNYFWSLKELLSSNLYLFDFKSIAGKSDQIAKIINQTFDLSSEKVNLFFNDFKEVEKIFSIELSAQKKYLEENTSLDKVEIEQVLNIIGDLNSYLIKYLGDFGDPKHGILSYDVYFQYLLNSVFSVQAFVEKYGLMPLLKSCLLSYEIDLSADFDININE